MGWRVRPGPRCCPKPGIGTKGYRGVLSFLAAAATGGNRPSKAANTRELHSCSSSELACCMRAAGTEVSPREAGQREGGTLAPRRQGSALSESRKWSSFHAASSHPTTHISHRAPPAETVNPVCLEPAEKWGANGGGSGGHWFSFLTFSFKFSCELLSKSSCNPAHISSRMFRQLHTSRTHQVPRTNPWVTNITMKHLRRAPTVVAQVNYIELKGKLILKVIAQICQIFLA